MADELKTFLAVFLGTPARMEAFRKLPEAERRAAEAKGMAAWGAWAQKHAAVTVGGAPLGRTKRVSASGTTDVRNDLAAYTVVRAASYEDAAKMFENHPHFTIFPGEAVEIMELLPIPGQRP